MILLMAVGCCLRVHGAGEYYYNADDLQHIGIARAATLEQVLQFSRFETHPPLGHILRHYWLMLGDSQAYVRSFSLLFGLALIPLYYRIGTVAQGKFTGLCCATLIAFSYGLVMQSYLVRNYALFCFLLSLSFYGFLRWRDGERLGVLPGYCGFGLAACLTHFSGIFAVAVMAACESFRLYRRRTTPRRQALWILANMLILIPAGAVYYTWQAALAHRVLHATCLQDHTLCWYALAYPVKVLYYLFPNQGLAIGLLLLVPLVRKKQNKALKAQAVLAALAACAGIFLVASGLYPFGDSRHSLWILPFIVLLAGMILSEASAGLEKRLALPNARLLKPFLLLPLFVLSLASYSPARRFADNGEYTLTNRQWQALSRRLTLLGPRDLIVSERSDAGLIVPPEAGFYRFLQSDYGGSVMPYGATRLLFRNVYMHYDTISLVKLLEEARARRLLENTDQLVFVRTSATRSAILNLTLCTALDKKIVTIPPIPEQDAGAWAAAPATLLFIPKSVFFDELVSTGGKAHSCLKAMTEY